MSRLAEVGKRASQCLRNPPTDLQLRFDIAIAGASLAAAFRGNRYRIALIEGHPRRCARARAEEAALLQWATHGLQRLFRPQYPALVALRNLGLNLTDSQPVERNRLVRYALG